MLKLSLGKTIEVLPGYFAHKCHRCLGAWISQQSDPATCAKCRNKYWRSPVIRKSVSEARKK